MFMWNNVCPWKSRFGGRIVPRGTETHPRHLQALKSVPRETFWRKVVRVFHVEHQFGGKPPITANQGSFLEKIAEIAHL